MTELVPQTNYSLQYNGDTVPSHQFPLHQVYMTISDTPPATSPIYNLQPTSHTSKPRILPYTTENLNFVNKFNFHYSDLMYTESFTLCSMFFEYQTYYATHNKWFWQNCNSISYYTQTQRSTYHTASF